jgi:hypothetical protein
MPKDHYYPKPAKNDPGEETKQPADFAFEETKREIKPPASEETSKPSAETPEQAALLYLADRMGPHILEAVQIILNGPQPAAKK